jgi:hypothetical protein
MTDMTPSRAGEPAQPFPYTTNANPHVDAPQPAARPVSVVRISAEADPNILARIIQPMVKLDLMPRALYVLSEDGAEMVAEIVFAASSSDRVRRLEHSLRAVIGITSVELLG